jgi:hypothetical protein
LNIVFLNKNNQGHRTLPLIVVISVNFQGSSARRIIPDLSYQDHLAQAIETLEICPSICLYYDLFNYL